jgi:hypothetical protein
LENNAYLEPPHVGSYFLSGLLGKALDGVCDLPGHDWNFSQLSWRRGLANDSCMKLVLNLPCMEPFEPTKDLKVLIACQGSIAAERVCAMLTRVGRNCGVEGRLIYTWWPFDSLAVTSLKKLAAIEAAAANVIVIDAQDQEELPEVVIDWCSKWLAMADYQPKALVALCDSDTPKKGVTQVVISQLKQVAEWGQMDFFANGSEVELEAALTEGLVPPPGHSARSRETGATRMAGRNRNVPAQPPVTCK